MTIAVASVGALVQADLTALRDSGEPLARVLVGRGHEEAGK